jgi:hypothetical protein
MCSVRPQAIFALSRKDVDESALSWAAWAWCEDDIPVPDRQPEDSKSAKEEVRSDASTCATEDEALPFPPQPFAIENTFVSLPAPARKRTESCPPRIHTPATVMLRNIPNRTKEPRIEEHLRSLGFGECGMHLPMDNRTGVNKGYAFIRLPDEETAKRFCEVVQGTSLLGRVSSSAKRLVAVFAANQGRPLRPRLPADQ